MQVPFTKRNKAYGSELFLCTLSFALLLTSSALGTLAIVGFLAPWGLIGLFHLREIPQIVTRNLGLLFIPYLAAISLTWSDDPMWTMRASAELWLTFIVGIFAAELIAPRIFIASLQTALMSIAGMSLTVGILNGQMRENIALQGIYDSKNAFSAVMAILMIVSVTIVLDSHRSRVLRGAGCAGILVAPPLLILGQSIGAIFAVFFALLLFMLLRWVSRFRQAPVRFLVYLTICLLLMGGIALLIVTETSPMGLLDVVGKDSSLTGRDYLWSRAFDIIRRQPLFGVGYQSFWRIGNPDAEELWSVSHVPSGAGFGFHNEYLDMLVALGTVGLVSMLTLFVTLAKRMAGAVLKPLDQKRSFASLIFMLFMLRTPIEGGIFQQFNIMAVLFCVAWSYLRPSRLTKACLRHDFSGTPSTVTQPRSQ